MTHSSQEEFGSTEQLSSRETTLERIEVLDQIIAAKDALLKEMHPYILDLMVRRHAEYTVPHTLLDREQAISKQLYDEPTYNDRFVHSVGNDGVGGDLDSRRGGEYNAVEQYGNDTPYARSIFTAAKELGFISPRPLEVPKEPVDAHLGIAESYLEPIEENVEAVVIPTAKSISNPMRVRDAIRNIESGAIQTKKIIIASCERPVDDDEREKLDALGLHYGETEFESAIAAFNDYAGTDLSPTMAEPFSMEVGGAERSGRQLVRTIELASGPLELIVVSAPFDPTRQIGVDSEGKPLLAQRANTVENLLAARHFMSDAPGLLVIESHDVWSKSQAEIADQILGPLGKRTIGTGPLKLERLKAGQNGEIILDKPGEVVDEIAKTYNYAITARIVAETERERLLASLEERPERLREEFIGKPVPFMKERLILKDGYRDIPIDTSDPRFTEPLVGIREFGIAGQSYYSRPNVLSPHPFNGVESEPELRASIVEGLVKINAHLKHPDITELFGGEVELFVEEGTRNKEVQAKLYSVEIPDLLRRNNPGMGDNDIKSRRDQIIAYPTIDTLRPSPHATGGAFDVSLRYKQPTPDYVEGAAVWMGYRDGDTGDVISPDYFEINETNETSDKIAQRNRRLFYRIMTGELFGEPTGFEVNPTELWHWSIGDQLWAALSSKKPYYGSADQLGV